MTEPGTPSDVPEADRAEQAALLDPDGVDRASAPAGPLGDREANEADVLEQEADVPLDEDDVPS